LIVPTISCLAWVFQIHPNGRNQCHAKADAVSPTPRCNPLILREPGKIGRHFLPLSRNLYRFPGNAIKGPKYGTPWHAPETHG
jgi:hypothetical protein